MLATTPTYVNDNWNLITDNGTTGVVDAGDVVRNNNDTINAGTITAVYGTDAFGVVTTGLAIGSNASFDNINDAIANTTTGGTVNVLEGTYNELVQVNKTVTLLGAQAGVDARIRTAVPETIISNGDGDFQILANNVTIDGFTLTGVINNPSDPPFTGLGAAIWTNPGFTGTNGGHQIFNNIIEGNISGIELDNDGTFQTTVQYNLIQNNNQPGAGSGNGIEVNFGLANAVIDNNKFVNNPNGSASIFIGGASINITNNTADSQIYLASATSGQIAGNVITNSTSGGIVLGGANSGLSITNNEVNGVAANFAAFRLRDDGVGPNSGLTVTNNKFIGGAGTYGVRPGVGSYFGTLTLTDNQISGGLAAIQNDDAALFIDASENYWGTSNAATVSASILGAGLANVDFTPLLDNGDIALATVGFQANHSSLTVHALGAQTGATGRIQEGINLVTSGGTVNVLTGSYTGGANATAKAVTLVAGAGPGQVTVNGNFTLDGNDTLPVDVNSSVAGTGYDQWIVNGAVTLGGATLSATGTRTNNDGDVLVLIKNDLLDPVSGIFAGRPEGSNVIVNGVTYQITYTYNAEAGTFGNGNDVALIDLLGSPTPAEGTAVLGSDPCGDLLQALIVTGTSGNDNIDIKQKGNSGSVEVKINNQLVGTFAESMFGRIVVYGLAGNDKITVQDKITKDAWLFGDAGNDDLMAGGGNSVLMGGIGDDHLQGGKGRDLIIGGMGKDHLQSTGGEDIMIAGTTSHDSNGAALCAIMDEWTRTDATYDVRVSHLKGPAGGGTAGGLNMPFYLNTSTVQDDGAEDKVESGSGRDWFFANTSGSGVLDKLSGRKSDEVLTEI